MLRTEQAHAQLTFSRSVAELLSPAFKLCLCSLRNALLVEQHKCNARKNVRMNSVCCQLGVLRSLLL